MLSETLTSLKSQKSVQSISESEKEGETSTPKLFSQNELRVQFRKNKAICQSVGRGRIYIVLITFVENFRSDKEKLRDG